MAYATHITIKDGRSATYSCTWNRLSHAWKRLRLARENWQSYLWQVSRSTDRQDEARNIGIEMSSLEIERKRLLKSAERQRRALAGYGDRTRRQVMSCR